MKTKICLFAAPLVLMVCLNQSSVAQQTNVESTATLIADYKRGIADGCRAEGARKGYPESRVESICNCNTAVLDRDLSQAERAKLVLLSKQNNQAAQYQVMAPHMAKLAACGNAP